MPLRIAMNYGRDAVLEPEARSEDRPIGGYVPRPWPFRSPWLAAATTYISLRCVRA